MVANLSASDWSTERGDAWRASLEPLEAMLAPINAPLIEALDLDAPYRIADIGCGGGETSISISRNAYPGSTVEGFDISPTLIESAKSKEAYGEVPIHFHVQDAAYPLKEDAQFDRLTSRFGVMFFPEEQRAFTNLSKWLKVGGRFAYAVWGPPADNPWMSSIRKVLSDHIVLPSPERSEPGPFRYQQPDKFSDLLEEAGFADIQNDIWNEKLLLGGGMPAHAAAEFALSAFSIGRHLNQSSETTQQAARFDLVSLFSEHETNGQVRMDACVHFVTGIRA